MSENEMNCPSVMHDFFQKDEEELSLTIRSEDEYCQGVTCSTRVKRESKSVKMDIQNVDVLGPAEVVKKLFCLPVSKDEPYFALHRMGNTLLIDSIIGLDEQKATPEHDKSSKKLPDIALFSPDRPRDSAGDVSGISVLTNSSVDKLMDGLPRASRTQSGDQDSIFKMDSPFLPPPGFYIPQCPPPMPFRHLLRWQLQKMKFAMGSDLVVYSTKDHPVVTVAPMDTTREVELSTCMDYYLDNVMANVPELALCLHAKGFLRGVSMCRTEDIPTLNCTITNRIQQCGWEESTEQTKSVHKDGKQKVSTHGSTPHGRSHHDRNDATESRKALFDPKVIEMNALTILQFLKENCNKDNGTYIVRLQKQKPDSELYMDNIDQEKTGAIQIFDLQSISLARQKKWKWLLAMLSQRFAVRLGHHYTEASPHSRVIIRDRQMSLFKSCYDLLSDIQTMGGGKHSTIRAAVLEQMADIRLARAESRKKQQSGQNCEEISGQGASGEHSNRKTGGSRGKAKDKKRRENDQNSRDERYTTDTKLKLSNSSTDHTNSGESFGELDSIDYSAEMLESVNILQQAMTDLLEAMKGGDSTISDGDDQSVNIHTNDADQSSQLEIGTASLSAAASPLPLTSSAIIIGDVACERVDLAESSHLLPQSVSDAVIMPPFSHFPTDEEEFQEESTCAVDVSLALQFSGLLHKTMLSCIYASRYLLQSHSGHSGEAIIAEAIRILVSLIPFCSDWIELTANLKAQVIKRKQCEDKTKTRHGNADNSTSSWSNVRDLNADNTTLTLCLPTLGSLAGDDIKTQDDDDDMFEETLQDFWGIDRTILSDMPLLWDVLGEICRELSRGRVYAVSALPTGGGRSRSASEGSDEWGVWLTHGSDIRRLACSFTSMVLQSSRFIPMDCQLQNQFKLMTAARPSELEHSNQQPFFDPILSTATIDFICGELCGGKHNVTVDKTTPLMSVLLELFHVVAPLTLLPGRPPRSGDDAFETSPRGEAVGRQQRPFLNPDALAESLEIQNYAFVVAAILEARAQSGWTKQHWLGEYYPCVGSKLMVRAFATTSHPEQCINHRMRELLRHVGDASNELGQQLYKNCIQNQIEIETLTAVSTDQPLDIILEPVYSGFIHSLLEPCQEADFYYSVALRLFSALCDKNITNSYFVHPEDNSNETDVRNKVTVQCNMSSMRRSLSSRLADAILARFVSHSPGHSQSKTTYALEHQSDNIAMAIERIIDTHLNKSGRPGDNVSADKKKRDRQKNPKSSDPKNHRAVYFYESIMKSNLILCAPIEFLESAISLCIEDHILSSQTTCQPIGYALQSECGLNYLAKGLLHRRCFNSKDIASCNKHIDISRSSLEQALFAFQRIPTTSAQRQEAITHYHLGAFHSMLWNAIIPQLEVERNDKDVSAIRSQSEKHLEQTMEHYRHAHQYFLKYDVGPTLASILLDMSDIYLTSYTHREQNIGRELNRLSNVLSSPRVGCKDSSNKEDESFSSAASIIAIRTTVSSLLGGSFRALADCRRFVLTPVVVDRHGKHMLEIGIIGRLVHSLQQLILKLLKVYASVCYDDGKDQSGRDSTVATLKQTYRKLHDDNTVFTRALGSDVIADNGADRRVQQPSLHRDASFEENSQIQTQRVLLTMVTSLCEAVDGMNSSEWMKENL